MRPTHSLEAARRLGRRWTAGPSARLRMETKEPEAEEGANKEMAEGSEEAAAVPRAEEEVAKAAGMVKVERVEEEAAVVARSGCPNASWEMASEVGAGEWPVVGTHPQTTHRSGGAPYLGVAADCSPAAADRWPAAAAVPATGTRAKAARAEAARLAAARPAAASKIAAAATPTGGEAATVPVELATPCPASVRPRLASLLRPRLASVRPCLQRHHHPRRRPRPAAVHPCPASVLHPCLALMLVLRPCLAWMLHPCLASVL